MYPTSPASTTASTIVDARPRMLSPPPPGVDPGAEHSRRNEQQRHPEHARLLTGCQRDAPVACFLRPDGNQVFLLRQPVHRVHEQVTVALNAKREVRSEVGV